MDFRIKVLLGLLSLVMVWGSIYIILGKYETALGVILGGFGGTLFAHYRVSKAIKKEKQKAEDPDE